MSHMKRTHLHTLTGFFDSALPEGAPGRMDPPDHARCEGGSTPPETPSGRAPDEINDGQGGGGSSVSAARQRSPQRRPAGAFRGAAAGGGVRGRSAFFGGFFY